jgi:hypothetical protein
MGKREMRRLRSEKCRGRENEGARKEEQRKLLEESKGRDARREMRHDWEKRGEIH